MVSIIKKLLKERREKDVVYRSHGIGFFGLLTIVFITLRLTGFIAWSWWWVLAPLWMPWVALAVLCLVVFLVTYLVVKY
jgi:fatty acid desaturase